MSWQMKDIRKEYGNDIIVLLPDTRNKMGELKNAWKEQGTTRLYVPYE